MAESIPVGSSNIPLIEAAPTRKIGRLERFLGPENYRIVKGLLKTPASILQEQLEIYDKVTEKKSSENPLFKEIIESQKKFAARTVKWEQDTVVSRTMAYNHYFGPKKAAAKKA